MRIGDSSPAYFNPADNRDRSDYNNRGNQLIFMLDMLHRITQMEAPSNNSLESEMSNSIHFILNGMDQTPPMPLNQLIDHYNATAKQVVGILNGLHPNLPLTFPSITEADPPNKPGSLFLNAMASLAKFLNKIASDFSFNTDVSQSMQAQVDAIQSLQNQAQWSPNDIYALTTNFFNAVNNSFPSYPAFKLPENIFQSPLTLA